MSAMLATSTLLASTSEELPALLPALVLAPILTALAVMLVPARGEDTPRQVALLGALVTAALSVYMLTQFQRGDAGYQFEVQTPWISDWGISWHLGVDGISLFLVVMTAVLFPISILGARAGHAPKAYYAWMSLLMAGSIGAFLSLDLLLFFACFELVLVPMYFLIGRWGHGNATYAANKFFLYTMFGSAFMLVGLLSLAFLNQRATGRLSFDLVELTASQAISTNAARWIFASFALAFAVKVPLFPVHTWLPDAHTEAPTAGSVVLAGVLLKLGAYGLIRFGLELFPEAARWATPVMMTVAVIGIIYGAIVAGMQTDLKRLIAYSSIAHMGFIVLGIFSLTIIGLNGGVIQMLNHPGVVPAGRLYLRAAPHPGHERAERSAGQGAHVGRVLHARDAQLGGSARAERFRRRVPLDVGGLADAPLVGGRRRLRRDPRRVLPAVGLPTGLPRRTDRRQRIDDRPQDRPTLADGVLRGHHRLLGRLPAAGARTHHPLGGAGGHPVGTT